MNLIDENEELEQEKNKKKDIKGNIDYNNGINISCNNTYGFYCSEKK